MRLFSRLPSTNQRKIFIDHTHHLAAHTYSILEILTGNGIGEKGCPFTNIYNKNQDQGYYTGNNKK